MRKCVCRILWTLPVLTMLLVNNSILSAQSPVETTTTQRDQGSIDIQQQDIDQQNKTATTSYYLYLRSLECTYSNYDYAYLKVNGNIVWRSQALSMNTNKITISINSIQVNKAKIELYVNSTASSKSATYVNKIYLTLNDLKNLVDQGAKSIPLQRNTYGIVA